MAQLLSWQSLIDLAWLLFLLIVFRFFWRERLAALQLRFWVKTQARIIECELITRNHNLWPKIEYMYHVGEYEYIGEDLFLDTKHHNPNSAYARKLAYRVTSAFKQDEDIDVYYNPDDPEQAVLDNTVPRKGFVA